MATKSNTGGWVGALTAWWRPSHEKSLEKRSHGQSMTIDELAAWCRLNGIASWSDKGFTSIVNEGYKTNPIVNRCVKIRCEAFGRLSLYVANKKTGKALPDHPLQKLLDKPNRTQSGTTFRTEALSNELLGGQNFIRAGVVGRSSVPAVIENIRPDGVVVQKNPSSRLPVAYQITGVDGTPVETIQVDQVTGKSRVLHLQQHNPLDHLQGLSPVAVAMQSVDITNQIAVWNKALLDNDGRPSGILKSGTAGLNLTDEQIESLREQYRELASEGLPMIGDFSWQEMGTNPKDMDHINTDHNSSRKIALSLGVPTQLVVPGESTFNNYAQARLALYEDTVLPDAYRFIDELNRWLVPMFDASETIEIRIDEDKITALQPRRDERLKTIAGLDFISDNEKRIEGGWEVRSGPAPTPYDEIYKPGGMLPVGMDFDGDEVDAEDGE